jgi:hypothetical protein
MGVLAPVAETVRRWDQIPDLSMAPLWLDDYVLGAFLLYGFSRIRRDPAGGLPFLAIGWAFACGMIYPSFFTQLTRLDQSDPAPVPSLWVAVVKGVAFAIAIAALTQCARSLSRPADAGARQSTDAFS